MMELMVMLDFACCSCEEMVAVTLKCEGENLTERSRKVAAVQVACPHCETCNYIYFEPNGTVRDVVPAPAAHQLLEPSVN